MGWIERLGAAVGASLADKIGVLEIKAPARPILCPVCKGAEAVPTDFYPLDAVPVWCSSATSPIDFSPVVTFTPTHVTCRACQGAGVLR